MAPRRSKAVYAALCVLVAFSITVDPSLAALPLSYSLPAPLANYSPEMGATSTADGESALVDSFNATAAYQAIATQTALGPRVPGTAANEGCVQWIEQSLDSIADVTVYNFTVNKSGEALTCQNVIGKYNPGHEDIVVFASHFDSRAVAEKDPDAAVRSQPIDGANDGASGVAVMLEMARALAAAEVAADCEIWFVFFDAEDQGWNNVFGIQGWAWCEGSMAMAQDMLSRPEAYFSGGQSLDSIQAFILFDMVGGPGLEFIHESHSSPDLFDHFFEIGQSLGYSDTFNPDAPKSGIVDDHIAFADEGVPTLDLIINFWDSNSAWPHHHTQADNLTNIDPSSLEITGKTALTFLYRTYVGPDGERAHYFHPPSFFSTLSSAHYILGGILLAAVVGVVAYNRKQSQKQKVGLIAGQLDRSKPEN